MVLDEQSSSSPKSAHSEGADWSEEDQNIVVGLIAVAVMCCTSAFAGVYFEKILKGTSTSLWIRNIQMAFFSVLPAIAKYLLQLSPQDPSADSAGDEQRTFLQGFGVTAWTLVLLQSFGGLLVAAIIRYADNVVKGLATCVAIVVATSFSVVFLGTNCTPNFVSGAILILGSAWVFSNHTKVLDKLSRFRKKGPLVNTEQSIVEIEPKEMV